MTKACLVVANFFESDDLQCPSQQLYGHALQRLSSGDKCDSVKATGDQESTEGNYASRTVPNQNLFNGIILIFAISLQLT
jgi:hypothetical protein